MGLIVAAAAAAAAAAAVSVSVSVSVSCIPLASFPRLPPCTNPTAGTAPFRVFCVLWPRRQTGQRRVEGLQGDPHMHDVRPPRALGNGGIVFKEITRLGDVRTQQCHRL